MWWPVPVKTASIFLFHCKKGRDLRPFFNLNVQVWRLDELLRDFLHDAVQDNALSGAGFAPPTAGERPGVKRVNRRKFWSGGEVPKGRRKLLLVKGAAQVACAISPPTDCKRSFKNNKQKGTA